MKNRSPHYRRLRLERCESRRVLSAASVADADSLDSLTFVQTPVGSGWTPIDLDSDLTPIRFADLLNFASTNATNGVSFGDRIGLGAWDASSVGSGFVINVLSDSTSLDRDRVVTVFLTGVDSHSLPQHFLTRAAGAGLFDEAQVFLKFSSSHTGTTLGTGSYEDFYAGDPLDSQDFTTTDLGGDSAANSKPLDPLTLGAGNDGVLEKAIDAPASTTDDLPPLRDIIGGSAYQRVIQPLRELSDHSETRVGSQGFAATPTDQAMAGSGMIDLAALLSPPDSTPEPATGLAAAPVESSPGETARQSARLTALAIESWVRTLPVPTEPAAMGATQAPTTPAIGDRQADPAPLKSPAPSASQGQASAGESAPTEASSGAETAAVQGDLLGPTSHIVAALTSLVGGSAVWISSRQRASDKPTGVEFPRRDKKSRP